MALFTFDVHTVRVIIPEDLQVQMGGGYIYSSRFPGPKPREFVLSFDTMKSYVDSAGLRITSATPGSNYEPKINWYRLMDFYAEHGTWKLFEYIYPPEGQISVRFKGPLEQPKVMPGGYGVLEPFELRLIEQP